MFQIGQHVIHPGQGVCTVTGFTEDKAHPMILLCAKSGHAETHLMYPLAQQDRLHAIISREDAESLLGNYADLPVDTFTERNSALEETHFKQQLKLGAPETVRVAKTMDSNAMSKGKDVRNLQGNNVNNMMKYMGLKLPSLRLSQRKYKFLSISFTDSNAVFTIWEVFFYFLCLVG